MQLNPSETGLTTIKSRRSIAFYATLVFAIIFYLVFLGPVLMAIAFDEETANYILIAASLLIFYLGFYTIYAYYRMAPKVIADNRGIAFNNRSYVWTDVESATFSGKMPFRYITLHSFEGMKLAFKGGATEYLHNTMYSNMAEIKRFVDSNVNAAAATLSPNAHQRYENYLPEPDIATEHPVKYKGNQLKTMQGIFIWLIIIGSIFFIALINDATVTALLFMFNILFFIILSIPLNYFCISEHYLIVRNHNLIWKRKTFLLANVSKILFDAEGRAENTLTIYNKDFSVNAFQAATLSNERWLALKRHLETAGVAVVDENNFADLVTPAGKKRNKMMHISFFAYFVFCGVAMTMTEMANLSEIVTKILMLLIALGGIVGMLFLYLYLVRKYVDNGTSD